MAAPVIVVLNRDYAEDVCRHLHGDVYLDSDVDRLLEAMHAATVVRAAALRDTQTDLFGGEPA